jgi:hypothetical protein
MMLALMCFIAVAMVLLLGVKQRGRGGVTVSLIAKKVRAFCGAFVDR